MRKTIKRLMWTLVPAAAGLLATALPAQAGSYTNHNESLVAPER
jgi:hypothetical protein